MQNPCLIKTALSVFIIKLSNGDTLHPEEERVTYKVLISSKQNLTEKYRKQILINAHECAIS